KIGGDLLAVVEHDAMAAGNERAQELVLVAACDGLERREDRDRHVDLIELVSYQRREARIFEGGRVGVPRDGIGERSKREHRSDAAAKRAVDLERHENAAWRANRLSLRAARQHGRIDARMRRILEGREARGDRTEGDL